MSFGKKASITLLSTTLIFGGCATDGQGGWGSKQTAGTAIGTILGAIVGSQIGGGSGKAVAAIVGALAGGLLGNMIGSSLDEKDRLALAASTQKALESGKKTNWKSEHSGASAVITPVSSKTVTQSTKIKRSQKIAQVDNLQIINQPYQAKKSAILRAAPNETGKKIGGFKAGQTFTALGKTNNNWIAVGRKGVTVGYVYAPLVGAATKHTDTATDLDKITVASAQQQGFDLDAIEPAKTVTQQVSVETQCREMKYSLKSSAGQEDKTFQACQDTNGTWQIG